MGGSEEKLGENERGATAESSNNRKQQGREGKAHEREGRRKGMEGPLIDGEQKR